MNYLGALFLMLATSSAQAEAIIATQKLDAGHVVSINDLTIDASIATQETADFDAFLGARLKHTVFPGHPLTQSDLAQNETVSRNQPITLQYKVGALSITTEGRALDAGAAGETIRVLNIASRNTVRARVISTAMAQVE